MPANPNLHATTGTLTATMSQVLLIDARQDHIEMLSIALSESWEDLTVVAVADVSAALAMVEAQPSCGTRPVLIVVAGDEAHLAIEVLRRLKSDPGSSQIPALLLCPQVSSGDYQRAVRLGAIELLREPATLDGYLRLAAGWQGLLARA